MKYLLTATLLNSFSWFFKLYSQKKVNEFKNTLRKLPFPKNEYMKAGIKFETDVMNYCHGKYLQDDDDYDWCVKEAGEIVKDGTWQVKGYCNIKVGDIEFLLYGIADVLKGPYIYDIKFVQKYKYGKYQNSVQHKIYFILFPAMTEFIYLISDGYQIYKESYGRNQADSLTSEIADFWSWLNQNPEYKKIFCEKWEAL